MPKTLYPDRLVEQNGWTVYGIVIDSEVVYVGCTSNPRKRLTQHRTMSFRGCDARMVMMAFHKTSKSALLVERNLIDLLEPKFNGVRKPDEIAREKAWSDDIISRIEPVNAT